MSPLSAPLQRFLQSLLWAVIAWTLMQSPFIQKSWLGAPDLEGLRTVLKLKQDQVGGRAAPLFFIDFAQEDWSAAAAWRPPPSAIAPPSDAGAAAPQTTAPASTSSPLYIPRPALAATLDFLRTTGASAVFIDVDSSAAPSPEDDRIYAAAIDRWRSTPHAPLLVLSRTDWTTPSILERNGYRPLGANEPVSEALVRIFASSQNAFDSVQYWNCEGRPGALAPKAHAAVYLAAASRFDDGMKAKAAVDGALARINCRTNQNRFAFVTPQGPMVFDSPDGPINFHLGLNETTAGGVQTWTSGAWKSASLRPTPAARCKTQSAPSALMFRVMDLLGSLGQAGVATDAFCGRMVVVGSSASIARDTFQTIYGPMPGAFIIGNAARGIDQVGPLRRFPYALGLIYVLLVTVVVFFAYRMISSAAKSLLERPTKGISSRISKFVVDNVTHPLTLSILIGNLLSFVGLAVTYFTISKGLWGLFAASALAASLSNAFDDVSDMRAALLSRHETGERA